MTFKSKAAICGLGITDQGKVFGKTAPQFGIEAVALALQDAGLDKSDLDGMLIYTGNATSGSSSFDQSVILPNFMGLRNMRLFSYVDTMGATAGAMLQYASLAVAAGMANYVACVFADGVARSTASQQDALHGAMHILDRLPHPHRLQASHGIAQHSRA